MKKLKGLFLILRVELPFAAGVCVVMGQVLASGRFAPALIATFAFLSIFAISASILVLNDYYDIETDRINAPNRPIPAGMVAPSEARILAILLMLAGILFAGRLGVPSLAGAVLLLIIGFLYDRKFKKTGLPGNLMVSFSVGMTFVYGSVTVGMPFSRTAWFFGVISALIDLGEEIAADAMDEAGDRLIRSKSLAIRYGRRTALRISGAIFILVILLTAVPFLLGWFPMAYIVPVAWMDAAIAYSTVRLLGSEDNAGRVYIRRLYLGATAGLLLFLLMKLLGV